MTQNSDIRHSNASLLAIAHEIPTEVVPSSFFEDQLSDTYKRLGLPKGLLERLAGIKERRAWADGVHFEDGAVAAAEKAIAESGVTKDQIGLIINASVTRDNLEPAVAVGIHDRLDLPRHALDFDITNACLGFVNAMTVASSMIDAGSVKYALIVAAEDPSPWHRTAMRILSKPDTTRDDVLAQFATLTLGSGAAAAVIGPSNAHPEGHKIVGTVSRAGTEHRNLCIGGEADQGMQTDAAGLLKHGLQLVAEAWREAQNEGWDWSNMDSIVTHQVSNAHTNAIIEAVDLDREKLPLTFPTWGNVASAALPMTLAQQAPTYSKGDRILCLGVGSGLNTALTEIIW
ncbi:MULTISPECIES: 3-oxoacyl-ACP synthase III [unclassified Rothia (in: high G+C Gram-positive bacteria)]|uniref:3-oxoacyl-ACP synthase III n=1 Tax=unclassified Rothia (in: high G+C Gram-positive bacteria) TaxID=2689056 RepID=UPI00195E7DB6|nr:MULTISPECIES: 3-oxoacyl-ACP synthase III [unclassified Rothia (in: high G+C Gram-positive bacteria)]MBM7050922.1 3-oxoacyl-ACP synthase III [Rothia sp. ZJ1223]QRZ62341.1 3-oxoacyl-ACP synthase III [Rothia sp. ZJ932]